MPSARRNQVDAGSPCSIIRDVQSLWTIAAIAEPHPLMILPFGVMLLAIALMPFLNGHWWERHYPKVAASLGLVTTLYYLFGLKRPERMLHVAFEYVSFMALIGSLFVISGGIHIRVKKAATPMANCMFLLAGAVLANILGTTGASILLIRPWIRMNQNRIKPFHVVFFIFIVSNIGGCLTPIGDPPLFLGYLKDVPFWWVFAACWPAWVIAVGSLLAAFFVLDRRDVPRSPPPEPMPEKWAFSGLRNLVFLAVVLMAVFLRYPPFLSEGIMIAAAVGSYFATPKNVHRENDFNFHPIIEVAWLFVGIFATMVPALDYLQIHSKELGLASDAAFFWLTGGLSAALDNAPTYLTFLAAAMGRQDLSLDDPAQLHQLLQINRHEAIAISLGAVFFGAMTYIGNGPNFMVKTIAERMKVKMPGFLAYLLIYAAPILLPLFALITILFLSRWRVF
jgi:Na+/H+ antiporter NhaD/arsenite permease-like protein